MNVERSEIQWGRTNIPYVIRRSPRRGTVGVAVEPGGRVVLTAPAGTSVPRLDRVVRLKAQWIVDRVRRRSDLPPPLHREFVSGETVMYLGKSYRLRVVFAREAGPAHLDRGWLVVGAVRGAGPERAGDIRRELVVWYRRHAEERLPERVMYWSRRLRVPLPAVLVRSPRQRWGSCDPTGTLRLNWRIMQAPTPLVDYVVAHELVHLQHRDHGAKFWAALGSILPNYDVLRARLRDLGPSLVW